MRWTRRAVQWVPRAPAPLPEPTANRFAFHPKAPRLGTGLEGAADGEADGGGGLGEQDGAPRQAAAQLGQDLPFEDARRKGDSFGHAEAGGGGLDQRVQAAQVVGPVDAERRVHHRQVHHPLQPGRSPQLEIGVANEFDVVGHAGGGEVGAYARQGALRQAQLRPTQDAVDAGVEEERDADRPHDGNPVLEVTHHLGVPAGDADAVGQPFHAAEAQPVTKAPSSRKASVLRRWLTGWKWVNWKVGRMVFWFPPSGPPSSVAPRKTLVPPVGNKGRLTVL